MAKLKLNPLDDRVVVKPAESEEKTVGGIVLPDNAKEKQQKGEVLAVGPGKLLDSGERATLSVKVGDVVHVRQVFRQRRQGRGNRSQDHARKRHSREGRVTRAPRWLADQRGSFPASASSLV